MKRIAFRLSKFFVLLLYLLPFFGLAQYLYTDTVFTEFYCDPVGGSNINAGDNKTIVTSTNGGWNSGTVTFTAASGTPFSGSSAGDFASVYIDGSSSTTYVARISSVGGGGASLVMDSTAFGGTAPSTAASGISCTVGGAWQGPHGNVTFPFGIVTAVLTDSAGDQPRVNLKNSANYDITVVCPVNQTGPIRWQGYSSSPGDFGKANILRSSGIGISLISTSGGANNTFADINFGPNGSSGTGSITTGAGSEMIFIRCVFHDSRGIGLNQSNNELVIFCEAYNNNGAGFYFSTGLAIYDYSHNNTNGYNSTGGVNYLYDIASNNSIAGFNDASSVGSLYINVDSYNNSGDGISLSNTSTASAFIMNSNLINNGGYGVNGATAFSRNGSISYCGFYGNTSGRTNSTNLYESNNFDYPSVPYANPANGDFRNISGLGLGTGSGTFTTIGSTSTIISYPNIGAIISKRFPGAALAISN